MSNISEQLEWEYAKSAAKQTPVDLGDVGEKLSIETVASCTFGVKAGAFQGQEQTEFCKKAYGLFVHNIRDFLFAVTMQIPWLKSLLYKLRVPINKPLHYIRETLMHMINHKKVSNNKGNDLIDFMSSALTKRENKIGREAFDEVMGLSGDEFLVANAIGLFIAAHDTTSVFLSYLFYELALNMDVQQRLQVRPLNLGIWKYIN